MWTFLPSHQNFFGLSRTLAGETEEMVCVVSPSLSLSFRPLRFYKNTEGLSQTLQRAGYPYFYLFAG